MFEQGIDLHKRTVVIAAVDFAGKLLQHSKLPARPGDLLRRSDAFDGPPRAVVEATGSWHWVADLPAVRIPLLGRPFDRNPSSLESGSPLGSRHLRLRTRRTETPWEE